MAETIKKISINELPKYTPWIARILGIETFSKPVRDIAKIDAQYDKDIYAKLLKYLDKNPGVGVNEIRRQEAIKDPRRKVCFSRKGELYVTSALNVQRVKDKALIDIMSGRVEGNNLVIELGCGYGYNLSLLDRAFPHHIWLGGEYSNNAVKLAGRLFTGQSNISVFPFNFYDTSWSILENIREKALVFTVFSIAELPHATSVLRTLARYQKKITEVIHVEPVYELLDSRSTLGLMRQAYIHLNNYNTDLLTTLESMNVKILQKDFDFIGTNPLCPISFIRWRFTR